MQELKMIVFTRSEDKMNTLRMFLMEHGFDYDEHDEVE